MKPLPQVLDDKGSKVDSWEIHPSSGATPEKKIKTMIPRYFQAVKITHSRVSKAFFVFPWKKIGSTQEKEKKMKVALYYF